MNTFYVSTCKIKLDHVDSRTVEIKIQPGKGSCCFNAEGCLKVKDQFENHVFLESIDEDSNGSLDVRTQYGECIRLNFIGSDFVMGLQLNS